MRHGGGDLHGGAQPAEGEHGEAGLDGKYTTTQCKIAEVPVKAEGYDLIVATTRVPDVGVPFINGVPLLTGVGADKVWDQIADAIRG